MVVKVKYNGGGGSETGDITVDGVYVVLAFLGGPGSADVPMLILDDNQALYRTVNSVTDFVWSLDSVTDIGPVQIFPEA